MITSTNRAVNDESLDFLTKNAYSGGLDLLHRFHNNIYFIDTRLIGSYVDGDRNAITLLQQSSARYYQRPGADYLGYDTSRTSLSGLGGKLRIGKGAGGHWRYSVGTSWLTPGLELNDIGYVQEVDKINQENEISYLTTQPVSIFRTYEIGLEQFNTWTFNGTYLGSGGHLSFVSELNNQWKFGANIIYHSSATDTRLLRGGFDFLKPYQLMAFGDLMSDISKKFIAGIEYTYDYTGNHAGSALKLAPTISLRPVSMLKLGLSANWEKNHDELQYVGSAIYLSDNRYILGTIDQETLGLTFRADLNITPELSIIYYGSPFVSKGIYSDFKKVTDAKADRYEDRFVIYNNASVSGGNLQLDDNNDGVVDYLVADPDFNFHQFRSNLVAKWEYRLGSFIYLVWSSERTGFADLPENSVGDSFDQLRKVYPKNIFLIKLNYWFSL